jgi:hypothetical protein
MGMAQPFSIGAVSLLGFVLLTSCAHQQRMSRDELRSALTSGVSLASEARLYLQYAAEGRTYRSFSEGHLHYLAEEAARTEKELRQAASAPEDTQVLDQARAQFGALSAELTLIDQNPSDAKALMLSMRRLAELGKAMEQEKSSL